MTSSELFSILKNNFEVEIQLYSLHNFLIYFTQSLIIFKLCLAIHLNTPTLPSYEKLKIKQRLRKQVSQTSGKMRSSSLYLIYKKGREIVFHSLIFKRIENSQIKIRRTYYSGKQKEKTELGDMLICFLK